MDLRDELVCGHSDYRDGAGPLAGSWVLPVFPDAGDAEGRAILHRDRIRLLSTARSPPFEEAVNRQDATAPCIGIAKSRQARDRFRLGVDRPTAAFRIVAPVGDEPPFQKID